MSNSGWAHSCGKIELVKMKHSLAQQEPSGYHESIVMKEG